VGGRQLAQNIWFVHVVRRERLDADAGEAVTLSEKFAIRSRCNSCSVLGRSDLWSARSPADKSQRLTAVGQHHYSNCRAYL
jgi:hypothetical protein